MFADKITLKLKLLNGVKLKLKMNMDGVLILKAEQDGRTAVNTVKIPNNEQSARLMADAAAELLKRAKGGLAMCIKCTINGHDKEDHAILAQSTSQVMDPLVKDAVDRQIDYAREALNEAFTAYIEEQRVNIEQTDYQAMSIMNGFFVYMMK